MIMSEMTHYLKYFEDSCRQCWDQPAMTLYRGNTLTYKDTAQAIMRYHLFFDQIGIQRGDKIALCGLNSPAWGVAYLAVCGYGAVAIPILNDFKPDSMINIVRHSDTRFLFISQSNWNDLPPQSLSDLLGVICLESGELLSCNDDKVATSLAQLDTLFSEKYPSFTPDSFALRYNDMDELAVINYTSGTTSMPKGVMLTNRNISSNIKYALETMPHKPGWHLLSMLPLAHMYGLAFEFLFQMAGGCHVFFLGKTPSPQILISAFAEVKPYLVITVPLVVEKIFKKSVMPALQTAKMKVLLSIPVINSLIYNKIREKILQVFGGNMWELVIGGAAINPEVEGLMKRIKFPYTVGYDMTECAPLLGYASHLVFKKRSCGQTVTRMVMKVDSTDPQHVVGELLAKGENVMMGYYKNEEATKATIDNDGWLHTGDLGLMDRDGFIFIKGRSKNMILGPSGQNIYPEEIEDFINNLPYVVESLVVDRDGKLVALVYPDYELAEKEGLSKEQIQEKMAENRLALNKMIPSYCPISSFELRQEEFEKTPKRSIRRFLYK